MVGKIIAVLVSAIISSVLYRAGGMGKEDTAEPKWIPMWMRNTKYRDLGCPTILIALLWYLFGFHWYYFLTFLLSFGALTTYWDDSKNKFIDKISRIINWKYPEDNHYLHGLMCGLAGIPLIWCGVPLYYIIIRIVICSVGMGLWSKLISNDVKEEIGRGVFFII